MVVNRFDVFLISLESARGSQIRRTRPCLVVSPDEMNHYIKTVIIAPMTTKERSYPTRVTCSFQGKQGQIVCDQIRTVDKSRLVRKLGLISTDVQTTVLEVLQSMFAE